MSERVSDFALMIGHVWRCTSCRDALLRDPAALSVGFKLNDTQRDCITSLGDDDFSTIAHLAEVTGLTAREIDAAIDHPRARLRHLGSVKGEIRPGLTW
ncbi:MAG: hypothetical protein H3C34_05845 [Caldilineaceae bacterium]|nr:hypothetical protein [Caldilineaceae bacterium]